MKLRYIHIKNYPPIDDMHVVFSSNSLLEKECSIRFVVGMNGSGKSNLLRAVAEVFLALADERMPPFPCSMVYELGRRGQPGHHTFVVDCLGERSQAALWRAEGWYWPDDTSIADFVHFVDVQGIEDYPSLQQFAPHIERGTYPQAAGIALPQTVLAYTTGDIKPWKSVWSRNQNGAQFDAGGYDSGGYDDENYDAPAAWLGLERPVGWTAAQEAIYQASLPTDSSSPSPLNAQIQEPKGLAPLFRRPLLLTTSLLKCALLAVALPQAFVYKSSPHAPSALQKLLERGGFLRLVSAAFTYRMPIGNAGLRRKELLRDWLMQAGDAVSLPHPEPARQQRVMHFDVNGHSRDEDKIATTQGEALWELLGGQAVSSFELFNKLVLLFNELVFEDLDLRVRRTERPQGDDVAGPSEDIGVLRYEELSDGEQMVLGRMALFHLLKGQNDALLLLDEPETHFNDKWKREIVSIIDEAIGDTANDVLISTHSAIVLSDVFNEEIVFIEKTAEGSFARTVTDQTFATDPSALMMTVFDADDSIGERAQNYIEKKLKKATGTNTDILQLEALINRMGTGFYRSELRTLLNTWKQPLRQGGADA
jgi:predicted ATPase